MNLAISGEVFALASISLLLFLLALIVAMRRLFATQKGVSNEVNPIIGRNKLPSVDAFRWTETFFKLGLVMSLCLVILAFSWTSYEEEIFIPEGALSIDDDIMIEPPRTMERPKPPPPPPPPVIEEVPDIEIDEEDEVIFEDQLVVEESVIAPPPVPTQKTSQPPKPPAPPKPKLDIPDCVSFAEEMPRFPGCEELSGTKDEKKLCADEKMLKFIYKNIKYPPIARENGVEGICVIQFIVETNGTISDTKVVRDIGGGCGEEALRVVELMNKKGKTWTPGKQRGRKVRVQFNLPVKYKLQ